MPLQITGKARVAGVMGWPVAHSRSPRLHGHWLDRYGIDGAYVPLPVPPGRIVEALHGLAALGFVGCNITIPHKEAAFAALDRYDDNALRLQAVNTIVVDSQGRLYGSNSDGFGFLENLKQGVPTFAVDRGPAVVLGAGGSAAAVAFALLDAGAPELRIVNRTPAKAEALAGRIGPRARVHPWAERTRALDGARLLVNATSLGMSGQPALDLDLSRLAGDAVVSDIVYVPLETELLRQARARGNSVVEGIGMLLHQARPGFKAWFGREPEVDDGLRRHMLRDLSAP
ncbi:MAG: shikimate dehydrogenase [Alphaproteobacteria bacterium]|nr:shikimate dehydrogenase [Alphaproteobacteria bacterium]